MLLALRVDLVRIILASKLDRQLTREIERLMLKVDPPVYANACGRSSISNRRRYDEILARPGAKCVKPTVLKPGLPG
jgi:hypothetical protein